MFRKTFAEINLSAIKNNIRALKESSGNKKVLLPVKADAYGHGIIEVSRYVEKNDIVDMLGVATLDEGVELRNAGIRLPILVLGLIVPYDQSLDAICNYNLSQIVADERLANKISEAARLKGKRVRLHLKIDTGMGRIGCKPEDAVALARKISTLESVMLEGICSHLPVADEVDVEFTIKQIDVFTKILDQLEAMGIEIPLKHIANSAGIVRFPDSVLTMIRPGIMSYGYLPASGLKEVDIPLEPAMTLKSCIVFSKRVARGVPLSYGLTYTMPEDANIATVAVGYGDGYSRFLSNRAAVMIQGKPYPQVGRITMDQILVNLGNDEYPAGEEVILFGKDTITVDTIADWMGTISYEVTCGISKRVPRLYKE
jgi:alanine racemase